MTDGRTSVLVLGSVNVDLVLRLPKLPGPGETVLGGEFFRAGGGKGANQAVAAARLAKEPVTFVGAVGDDDFGRQALDELRNENLRLDHVRVLPGKATGVALIAVDPVGQNQIGVASGANACLNVNDIDRLPMDLFRSAKVFLSALENPMPVVRRAIERAKNDGAMTILNPAPADFVVFQRDSLESIEVLTPNEGEAALITGMSGAGLDHWQRTADKLQQMGSRGGVITLGSQGCFVYQDEMRRHLPANHVSAIDATGAGDCFNGALAVALAEGVDLLSAARFAMQAAEISVTRLGAQPSMPWRRELADCRKS